MSPGGAAQTSCLPTSQPLDSADPASPSAVSENAARSSTSSTTRCSIRELQPEARLVQRRGGPVERALVARPMEQVGRRAAAAAVSRHSSASVLGCGPPPHQSRSAASPVSSSSQLRVAWRSALRFMSSRFSWRLPGYGQERSSVGAAPTTGDGARCSPSGRRSSSSTP